MKGGIPRNSCLAQWRNREVEGNLVSSTKALTRFSSLYIGLYSNIDVTCLLFIYVV